MITFKKQFWYESNAYFGMVKTSDDLNEALKHQMDENNGYDSIDELLDGSKQGGSANFGTRREHTGMTLREFLINQGFDCSVLRFVDEAEFILCSAIDHNGTIICGRRHRDCYEILNKLTNNTLSENETPDREHQGFITSTNRYVDRKEGWGIALRKGQIKHGLVVSDKGGDSELISENLY